MRPLDVVNSSITRRDSKGRKDAAKGRKEVLKIVAMYFHFVLISNSHLQKWQTKYLSCRSDVRFSNFSLQVPPNTIFYLQSTTSSTI